MEVPGRNQRLYRFRNTLIFRVVKIEDKVLLFIQQTDLTIEAWIYTMVSLPKLQLIECDYDMFFQVSLTNLSFTNKAVVEVLMLTM
jgi:hypothetical protein